MARQNGERQELRSIHNRDNSYVTFVNMTPHNVTIYWLDYEGKCVPYKSLGQRDWLDVNTFVTHPWIFVEKETKDRYLGNGSEVYFPEPCTAQGYRHAQQGERVKRTIVRITRPLYSLRGACLRLIKHRLRRDRDAYRLELPRCLQLELCHLRPRKPDPEDEERPASEPSGPTL